MLGPVPDETPAAVAGFSAGDTVTRIGGEPVQTWQDARWVLLQHAVKKSRVAIETTSVAERRAERELDLTRLTAADLDSDFLRALGLARHQPPIAAVIGKVVARRRGRARRAEGGRRDRVDRRQGDRRVGGRRVAVRAHPGASSDARSAARGARCDVRGDDRVADGERRADRAHRRGAENRSASALASMMTEVRYGPLESIGKAIYKTWDTSLFSLQMLGKMIVGEVSLKNLSGPITIADYAGQSAQVGWVSYLLFLALISISLGVLNLLPVPLLDGGHLMYYIFEIFKGSPVSDKAIEIGQHLGMALAVRVDGFCFI